MLIVQDKSLPKIFHFPHTLFKAPRHGVHIPSFFKNFMPLIPLKVTTRSLQYDPVLPFIKDVIETHFFQFASSHKNSLFYSLIHQTFPIQ